MADVGPLLRLYGVADSVFAEPPDGEVPPELESWLPGNARPDAAGWYDQAREALRLENTPQITPDNRVEVARDALAEIRSQSADVLLQPNQVLHAVTAAARALPEAFAPDGPLREEGTAAVHVALTSLSSDEVRASLSSDEGSVTADAVLDAFIAPPEDGVIPSDPWAAALRKAQLTDQPELEEPPCKDELTPAMTRRGEPTLAAKLSTSYDLDDVTLEDACSNFLAPGRWPECAKSLWEQMSPCDDKGWITDDNGVERQSFREVVQIDGVAIVTCLTFAKAVSADECELAYDLCGEATAGSCAGGPIGDAVTVDHGYILVTKKKKKQRKKNGAGVHVTTVKTLRFRPPLDGVGAAMLACAIGYGPAGYAMAESCSQGGENAG